MVSVDISHTEETRVIRELGKVLQCCSQGVAVL